jgi:site-specific DNA recombinase
MRAAIYARYSSDLQRPTSIEDQVRQCQRAADHKGWAILSDYIRSDSEVSGATTIQREALNSLIADARRLPKPFDCLLIDDTSRLGRNLTDVLKISEILKHHGVFLYFVSQQLDSREKSFRQLQIMNGMMDEQFLVGLSDKVHRGQEGRVLQGLVAGGRCYGYKNVVLEDFSRQGEHGRPAVRGVRQEILLEEARVIRRMFDMSGNGKSLATIAKEFNLAKISAPRPRRGGVQAWSPNAIHSMLRNSRYRGIIVWNRSYKVRNPDTGKKQGRDRPPEEWITVEAPQLRIVSEEQWDKVQARIKQNGEKFGTARLGGLGRKDQNNKYIFSGLLTCAICGYRIVIVGGSGTSSRYGCPNHRYKGVCPNGVTILHGRLERQLLRGLMKGVLRPDMLEHTIVQFHEQMKRDSAQLVEARKRTRSEAPKLKADLRKLEIEARNLSGAIAQYGTHRSPTLLTQLSHVENRIDTITRELEEPVSEIPDVPIEHIREIVLQKAKDLEDILLGSPEDAKLALRTHVRPLVLTPIESPEGPLLRVSGTVDLFSGASPVMPLVAPQGFEPRLIGSEPTVLPLNEGATD